MRVVFFGTPEFAVPSLRALVAHGAEVVAVVSQPDRPQGRSHSTLIPPPVKSAAQALGLPVHQPERPRGDVFLTQLRRLAPDLGVVVAYGHILRPEVLDSPRLGMINVHASLLPRHRGAAPVQAAILAGDRETGVTVIRMDPGMDTGPVLHRLRTPIAADETAGQLATRLAELGAQALRDTLATLDRGEPPSEPQDEACASYAPKIDRDVARVSWDEPAERVVRRVRAFDPAPGAWTTLEGTELKLFGTRVEAATGAPGTILRIDPALVVAAGERSVAIAEVQPAGRRRMTADAWVRGRGARVGQRFV
jgi:methionyl-tRNA formyltransferase